MRFIVEILFGTFCRFLTTCDSKWPNDRNCPSPGQWKHVWVCRALAESHALQAAWSQPRCQATRRLVTRWKAWRVTIAFVVSSCGRVLMTSSPLRRQTSSSSFSLFFNRMDPEDSCSRLSAASWVSGHGSREQHDAVSPHARPRSPRILSCVLTLRDK